MEKKIKYSQNGKRHCYKVFEIIEVSVKGCGMELSRET